MVAVAETQENMKCSLYKENFSRISGPCLFFWLPSSILTKVDEKCVFCPDFAFFILRPFIVEIERKGIDQKRCLMLLLEKKCFSIS